eukprot:5185555-Prymnesium_polylepis.1
MAWTVRGGTTERPMGAGRAARRVECAPPAPQLSGVAQEGAAVVLNSSRAGSGLHFERLPNNSLRLRLPGRESRLRERSVSVRVRHTKGWLRRWEFEAACGRR